MPRMDNPNAADQLIKMLMIGEGKTRKTGWAASAAADGFNVLYLDGDVAAQTIAIPEIKDKHRIYLLPFGDDLIDGEREPLFQENFKELCLDPKYLWNDSRGIPFHKKQFSADFKDDVWQINIGALDWHWVLVLDSWTSIVESCMLFAAKTLDVDLATARVVDMREVYRIVGNRLNQFLTMIRAANCHVIVIAHPDEYQKTKAPEGGKVGTTQEKDRIIEWTKRIPKSSSRPHSMSMSKYFTDVAWTEITPSGKARLNFKQSEDWICGGHFNDAADFETYSFGNLVRKIGGAIPDGNQPLGDGLIIHPNGTYIPRGMKALDAQAANEKPLDLSKESTAAVTPPATPAKGKSLSELMAAKGSS
jgi:hypothetical protein